MDRAALLGSFRKNLEEFEKFQGFIDKAKSQQGKFAASIVEKVIKDNTAKVMGLAETMVPMIMDIETEIATLGVERETLGTERAAEEFQFQVLELRLTIEEITKAQFDTSSAAGRASIAKYDAALAAIDGELAQFNDVSQRWTTVGEAAGVLEPAAAPAKGKKSAGTAGARR
jgi:hypothetical protein